MTLRLGPYSIVRPSAWAYAAPMVHSNVEPVSIMIDVTLSPNLPRMTESSTSKGSLVLGPMSIHDAALSRWIKHRLSLKKLKPSRLTLIVESILTSISNYLSTTFMGILTFPATCTKQKPQLRPVVSLTEVNLQPESTIQRVGTPNTVVSIHIRSSL